MVGSTRTAKMKPMEGLVTREPKTNSAPLSENESSLTMMSFMVAKK